MSIIVVNYDLFYTFYDILLFFQEHGYLVHRRKIGNYMLFRCLNCGIDAYSMHISGSPIVASNELLVSNLLIMELLQGLPW